MLSFYREALLLHGEAGPMTGAFSQSNQRVYLPCWSGTDAGKKILRWKG